MFISKLFINFTKKQKNMTIKSTTNEKVLKFRKILQQQYKCGKISKNEYEKELKWIRENIRK